MRILIAGQTYYPDANGQAAFTTHLAEGLARQGHQVAVIIPAEKLRSYNVKRNNVHIIKVAAISLAPRYTDVRITPYPNIQVGQVLAEFRPEVVHIQYHYPLCYSVLRAARQRRLPVLGTNHFLPENIIRNLPIPPRTEKTAASLLWWTMLLVFNQLDAVTTPTRTAANILQEQKIRRPVYPISCGVDLNRFRPDVHVDRAGIRRRYGLNPERILFLFVGRIDREKRVDVLLQAIHQLPRHDVQLGIAGRGSHQGALRALAQEQGLGDKVVFLGYVPAEDLPALLNSADVFVMPGEAELQSIATLEAMATGRPVLAANARALPELVENGVNGYLFRPGDAEDVARRMNQLVAERDRWAEMGQASWERVRLHSLENTLRRYEEVYHYLVRAPQPAVVRTLRMAH